MPQRFPFATDSTTAGSVHISLEEVMSHGYLMERFLDRLCMYEYGCSDVSMRKVINQPLTAVQMMHLGR